MRPGLTILLLALVGCAPLRTYDGPRRAAHERALVRVEQHLQREVWIHRVDQHLAQRPTARAELAPGPHEVEVRVVIRGRGQREERVRVLQIDAAPGATYVLHAVRDLEGAQVWVERPGASGAGDPL